MGVIARMIMKIFFISPKTAAQYVMSLVEAKDFEEKSGLYFDQNKLTPLNSMATDEESGKWMWDYSEKLCNNSK